MFHSNTDELIEYWAGLKGADLAPRRAGVDPMQFARLLPQTFTLARRDIGDYVFRLVGGFVGELHGRDLRGQDFTALWAEKDRTKLAIACEGARRRGEPLVVACEVQAGAETLAMEVLLAPLANPEGQIDRYLGLYQPLEPVEVLRRATAEVLKLKAFNAANEDAPKLRLAVLDGRLVG
jgi:hypothetical protein